MKHTAYINRWIAFFPLLSSKKEERGVRHRQVRRSWPLSHLPHPPQEAEQSREFLPPASLSLFTAFFPLDKLLKFPGPQLSSVSWGTACTYHIR